MSSTSISIHCWISTLSNKSTVVSVIWRAACQDSQGVVIYSLVVLTHLFFIGRCFVNLVKSHNIFLKSIHAPTTTFETYAPSKYSKACIWTNLGALILCTPNNRNSEQSNHTQYKRSKVGYNKCILVSFIADMLIIVIQDLILRSLLTSLLF